MSVLLYEPGLFALLDSPIGPLGRNVTEKAEAVALLARENVDANFTRRSGKLHNSIGIFPRETVEGVAFEVGTEGAPYGRVLELGAEPHMIVARRANVLESEPDNPTPLRGYREREDPTRVVHPGSGPRPWLVPALETVFNGG